MSILLALSLSLLVAASAALPGLQLTSKQWTYITEGVGIAGILIDKSTAADVVSAFGKKYTVTTHNEYSRSIQYSDLGLSFYYCLKDKQKTIFLIEVLQGTTSKGIVIGQSTLKDVSDLYGEEDDKNCTSGSCVYEYKGVQFYVEGPNNIANEGDVDPLQMKVVEIDVMSPDKSSNFCDGIEQIVGLERGARASQVD
jgi:hypothetical protein